MFPLHHGLEAKTPLKNDLRDLFHNRPWWILLGAGIASLVFNSIRDGATVYYFKYFVDETAFGDIKFLGIPFVLSGLYLAVGQAANIVGVHADKGSAALGTGRKQYESAA